MFGIENIYQEKIVRLLINSKRPLSTKQIAMLSHINWVTVRKHLNTLRKNGIVYRKGMGNKIFWSTDNYKLQEYIGRTY